MDAAQIRRPLPIRRGLTTWIAALAILAFVVSLRGFAIGRLSLGGHVLGAGFCFYIIAICCHDTIHYAAHPNRRVNEIVGWVTTWLVGGPLWVYKRAHLAHHARSDQPDDPERWGYAHGLWLPFCWLTGNLSYYAILREAPRREWIASALVLGSYVALGVAWPRELLLGWLLPMQIAAASFAFATVYLPHGPWRELALRHIPLVTGYHHAHHARPAHPWHQYHSLSRSLYGTSGAATAASPTGQTSGAGQG